MADINLNTLTDRSLAAGGDYLFGLDQSGGTVIGWRMPVADVQAAGTLAASALQPSDVAPMAYEDTDAWVSRVEYDATVLALTAANANLSTRIAQIETLVGAGSIAVYQAGVYEPGVYV